MIDPGYINYPSNPFKAVAETLGTGTDVTIAAYTQAAPPPPLESNALWQEASKQLGVTLKLNNQPAGGLSHDATDNHLCR